MRILSVVVSAGALIFRSMEFVWTGNGRVYTRLINGGSSPAELLSALASKATRERDFDPFDFRSDDYRC